MDAIAHSQATLPDSYWLAHSGWLDAERAHSLQRSRYPGSSGWSL